MPLSALLPPITPSPSSLVERTIDPAGNDLQGIDELRVEARGELDTHAGGEEHEVEPSQIGLLVPGDLVLLDDASEDGVDLGLLLTLKNTHVVVREEKKDRDVKGQLCSGDG